MSPRLSLAAVVGAIVVAVALVPPGRSEPAAKKLAIPEMKFDEVKEIAPGVFFRYSSISATDPKVPFGGSNHTWVLFKDHVVVIDANFPKEAGDVLAAIKKTTKLPIKYVLDTHHHGDHAYGNAVWAKEGAKIIGHTHAARLLMANGAKQWEEQAKDRKDVKESHLHQVDEHFDDKLVLDDGTQRVEFLHLGHSHTRGDAVAYLPKHKILCTGDACVNGAFNFMGHSNSAEWVKCLEKMEKLDVDLVCPGHGPVAGKDLIAKQKRYFVELRAAVQKGIDVKKTVDEIAAGLDMPWYKEWTGKAANDIKDNVKHVFDELTGKIDHERLGAAPRVGRDDLVRR
ncbi:MBL fold metallo-hydrolase [Limnoglobus roseus]|uniref:MBL fold metallo-hydrolase n=1 Tax=Limnoglobus roseus TaxID=2598579 RepID=A0A5C1A6P8_9BACT|nr:MBL fold metallo-hydrolase [Limnoglobus roseus]QEL14430.1 MBL fold metallo-hydrolase [Limnoglobus roseus]